MSSTFANLREKFRTSDRCVEASCRDRPPGSSSDEVEPPDRAEIGRAAWRYLHSMAAHHPETATQPQQSDTLAWIAALVHLYPCRHCAEHFVGVCEEMPPRLATREDHVMWWCEAHNRVSSDLQNETRPCDPARLLLAGRQGLGLDELPSCNTGIE
mmetsp:Transcript_107600/g.213777  ORF Transcript_107600/g.213777 Transcript_107600/m.213777 type:complete len:156 (+) Transcript_107600:44-511(+)|eukprot:CAMPEP_0172722796 /NCGR_PEP_ID=MMETSP1074-20121228/82331_1 /TAXON_ID=2916 /ORGANISM="Ceratium fusus, Strain PA161109" /LENGTH=155 /DNA_ID=CAMNT_0013548879 /DNA_START=41 /DNA_END=508 /DNA_ORIENTATION=+